MTWFLIAILGYFCSAVVALFHRYLLKGPIPNPKVYSFYVGVLGILALFLIPLGFSIQEPLQIILSLVSGALFIYSLSWFCKALSLFEVSRVVPAIGGLTPLFTFILVYLFFDKELSFGFSEIIAFVFLVSGSVLISFKREKHITLESFRISVIATFFFSIAFFMAKLAYLSQSFWSAFIWMRIGAFLMALTFLFSKKVREELFTKRKSFKSKTAKIFLLGHIFGAGSIIFQNWAIALVPLTFLPFINALEGTKYIFLLIFTILLSFRFPMILKEDFSKRVLFQKVVSILLIIAGMVILTLK